MGTITKEDKLSIMGELVSSFAIRVLSEEISAYHKDNPDAVISADSKDLIQKRAVSELMLRSCYFKCDSDMDEEGFKEAFKEWFTTSEEKKLRNMCYTNVKAEVAKTSSDVDDNLSFSERCHKHIQEEWNNIRAK